MGERVLAQGVDAAFGGAKAPRYSRPVAVSGDRFTLPERTIAKRISNKPPNEVSQVEAVQKDIVRQGGMLKDRTGSRHRCADRR